MKKKARTTLIGLLVCLALLLSGCSRRDTDASDLNGSAQLSDKLVQTVVAPKWTPIHYKVSFDLNGGELISGETEQVVAAGSAAEAPEAVNGDLQLSWDTDFSKITGDTVVTARWEKVKMNENIEELTQYVQERTVSLHVKRLDGSEIDGTGFFIDENGTIATTWCVIEGATEITVTDNDGRKFTVSKIVDFNRGLNLAILKADAQNSKYLKLSGEIVQCRETVYMINNVAKTLNVAVVRDQDLKLGIKEYLELDRAFSSNNAGAPVVNQYGEVVGINSTGVDSDALAIKIGFLENLDRNKNWTVQEFGSWYEDEMARSYRAWDGEKYYITTINAYQAVTNQKCVYSCAGGEYMEGYIENCETYDYTYNMDERDQYIAYLEEQGFHCYASSVVDKGIVLYYVNENEGFRVYLAVVSVPNEADLLGITVRTIS